MSEYNILNKFQKKALIKSISDFDIANIFYTLGKGNLETYVILYCYGGFVFTHFVSPKFLQLDKEHNFSDLISAVEERLAKDIIILENAFFNNLCFEELSEGIQLQQTYDLIFYFLQGFYFSGLLSYDPYETSEDIKNDIKRYLEVGLTPLDIYKHFLKTSCIETEKVLNEVKLYAY